ncbi:sulfatase, partial [Planctomycetota bacterium]
MTQDRDRRLSLIVVCFDTLRNDMIQHVGVDWIATPNMDRLARQSVIFERCFAEGLPTLPVRRAWFTGMRSFPWRWEMDLAGLWPTLRGWHRIPDDQPALAEMLLGQGYTTGLVADTFHMLKAGTNFVRGFSSFDWIRGQETDPWKAGPLDAIDLSRYARPGASIQPLRMLCQYLLNVQDRESEDDYFCARVASSAIRWLEANADDGQPLFLWVDFFDPHEPWDPPRHYADAYFDDYEGPELIHGTPPNPTEKEKERIKALYAGEVTFVDACFGRLLDKIEALGLLDSSIIMLVTDHGTELWEHGGLHKGGHKMHPYINQQAWFVRHPHAPLRDRRVSAFVQDHDLFPTALRLLGVEHALVDGIDVWPIVTGDAASVRDHIVTGFREWACVRDDEWCYQVQFEKPDAKARLFHHTEDPGEQHDVAAEFPESIPFLVENVRLLPGHDA